jgi:hypothetical protein
MAGNCRRSAPANALDSLWQSEPAKSIEKDVLDGEHWRCCGRCSGRGESLIGSIWNTWIGKEGCRVGNQRGSQES